MPISSYLRDLRARVGSDLLVLPAVTIMIFDDADRLLMARDKETGLWMTNGGAIDRHASIGEGPSGGTQPPIRDPGREATASRRGGDRGRAPVLLLRSRNTVVSAATVS